MKTPCRSQVYSGAARPMDTDEAVPVPSQHGGEDGRSGDRTLENSATDPATGLWHPLAPNEPCRREESSCQQPGRQARLESVDPEPVSEAARAALSDVTKLNQLDCSIFAGKTGDGSRPTGRATRTRVTPLGDRAALRSAVTKRVFGRSVRQGHDAALPGIRMVTHIHHIPGDAFLGPVRRPACATRVLQRPIRSAVGPSPRTRPARSGPA
jgi:hypothetical protein